MAGVVPIWIPCEAFDVTLTADDDEPTDLEKAVMLYLAWRDDLSLDDVQHFLGLSQRVTMDLLTGLWRLGYILVDTIDGAIQLDAPWKHLVEQAQWSKIKTAHRVSETVAMMRDLVSGQLVGDRSSAAAPSPADAGPILVTTNLIEGVSRPALATTALRNLRRNSPLQRRQRKIHAELAKSAVGSTPRNLSWLRLEFEAALDEDAEGSLTIRPVASDDEVLARIAPGIANALSEWALRSPDHPLVQALVKSATTLRLQPRKSLEAKLHVLTDSIGIAARNPTAHQHQLDAWARELAVLSAEIETVVAAGCAVALYAPDDHRLSFMDLASNFEHQLILASPIIDSDGLEICGQTLVPHLKHAESDASAVVLWGSRKQRQMTSQSLNRLANLATETASSRGARLLSATRSSRIATAFAVIDGRDILYASHAPLASSGGRDGFPFLLKIVPGARSTMAKRLSEIARDRAPDAEMAARIEIQPWTSFSADVSQSEGPDLFLDDSEPTEELADATASDVLALAVRLHDLKQECQFAAHRLASAGTTAEVLVDAAVFHCGLEIVADLDTHSAEPTLWLGFGSDDALGRGVPLHRSMVAAIDQRAAAGLATLVLVNDQQPGAAIDVSSLRLVADRRPGLVSIIASPGLSSQFVCGEHRFVATPGGLASPPIMEVRGLASRLIGFSVADQVLCANFREALARRWPAVGQLAPSVGLPRTPLSPQPPVRVTTQPSVMAWRVAPPPSRRAALAATLRDGEEHFNSELADTLLELTLNADDSGMASFRTDLLALVAARGAEGQRSRALGELAETAWRDAQWQQAALMLDLQSGANSTLPADLAIAMAEVTVGATPDLSTALERDDPDSWLIVVALSIWAVLFNGDAESAKALEIKVFIGAQPTGAEPLLRIANAVLGYWAAMGNEVDAAMIVSMSTRAEAESQLVSRAQALVTAFRLGRNREYNNAMLKRVVPRFYADTSGLKPVMALIPEDGAPDSWVPILRELNGVFGEGTVNADALADKLFDKAYKDYALGNDPPLVMGSKGRAIRSAMRVFVSRALALRDAIQASRTQPGAASPSLEQLVSVLRSETQQLDHLLEALSPKAFARPVLVQLRHRLDQLMGAQP